MISSDNEQFKVDHEVATRSVLIKNMIEGKPSATPVGLVVFAPTC